MLERSTWHYLLQVHWRRCGLDHLTKSLPGKAKAGQLERLALFGAVQPRPKFDPQNFAKLLRQFKEALDVGKN